jgi:cobalt/nickel transport protein
MRRKAWPSLVGLSVLLGCLAVAAVAGHSNEDRLGTDERAEQVIQELRPGYQPWCVSWFVPSRATERVLFGFQALLGVALVTYAVVSYRRLKAQRQRHAPSD